MLRLVRTTSSSLAEQPLAQVVLDRPGAHARALGELGHLEHAVAQLVRQLMYRMNEPCTCPPAPATAAGLVQRRDLLAVKPAAGEHLVGVLAERRARAPAPGRPACGSSLIGAPSSLTGRSAPGCVELDDHLPRGHQLATRAPRRGRAPAPGSSRARRRTGATARGCASAKISQTARCASEPGGSNACSTQVLAADAVAPGLPELRLERAQRDVAVGAAVRPVARQRAGQLELAAARGAGRWRTSRPRPAPATTARRRTSSSRRTGPRPSARARAARPGSRSRPSARRRRCRRSGRPPGPAGRPPRRSARGSR